MQHVKFYSQTVKILMHKVSLSAQKVISNITVIVHRHETSVNFFLEAKNNFQFCRQGFLGKNSFFLVVSVKAITQMLTKGLFTGRFTVRFYASCFCSKPVN